jgi:D-alanyl-D-alanine carboxypeptidase (penicillin-binding protein 5/6)
LIERHKGHVAVAVKHLDSGAFYGYREQAVMPTASLIKFPVMVAAYQAAAEGRLDLDTLVTLKEDDRVPGSGILTSHFSPGTRLSLRDAVRLMIVYSDNTATNLVLDALGIEATARLMEHMEMPNTRIHAKVFRRETSVDPNRSRQYGLGSTTALETLTLYERLHREELVSAEASRRMLDHLRHCEDDRKLKRDLPDGTKIAHKSGATSRIRCDAGLIESPGGTLVVCVLTGENEDRSWSDSNQAERLCGAIAKVAYEHFNPPNNGDVAVDNTLRVGASGQLVESLQRTLNARLEPSPDLAIDGDFGPRTEAAVKRFQESRKIAADGVVERATWKALGTLVTDDPPVAEPREINEAQLPRSPADPLDGPPWVTCKAWAVADAATGRVLWGDAQHKPLDQASTTKIMTAYLVLRLAEQDSKVLQEEVVFSRRADATNGSTAGLRAGERLTVEELLYGLLLPSGNDASVALAEHFGGRFEPSAEGPAEQDPLARFVAEMNRAAEQLELTATRFQNPHGLTAERHHASAADLVRLAWHCLQLPRFRDYIATRQRGCTVVGEGGYRRNVVWKNTNQLLATNGYAGVKTGTTRAAGACLVSLGTRQDDALLVAVLGSAASPARYTDTRNLFRWAWQRRLDEADRDAAAQTGRTETGAK